MTSEADFQRAVIDLAEVCGWKVCHFHDSRRQIRPGVFIGDRQAKGFPDLVLAHHKHGLAFAELKSDKGRVSPDQMAWINQLQRAGQVVYVWRPRNEREISRFLKFGGPAPMGVGDPPSSDRPGSDRATKTPIPPISPTTREVAA